MGHNFHLMLSLCSKEVTFPYRPFPKSKLCIFNEFQDTFWRALFLVDFPWVVVFVLNFPQSFVTTVAVYGHRIHGFHHRIFRSDQNECKLSRRILSRNHFMGVKFKVQSLTGLDNKITNKTLHWINRAYFVLNRNFDIVNILKWKSR